MAKKRRSGRYWAVEFAGEQVRLCRFRLRGSHVEVEDCRTVSADLFDFHKIAQTNGQDRSREGEVFCAIPRSEVLLKPFSVPRSDAMDVGKVASLRLEQSVTGFDTGSTLWGYVEQAVQEDGKRAHVLTAAVPRAYVDKLIARHFTDTARPTLMECASLSAVRAYLAGREQPTACEIVVDCAADGLSVFVVKSSRIDSAHFIPTERPLQTALSEIRRLILFMRRSREETPVEAVTCLGGEMAEHLAAALRPTLDIPVADQMTRTPGWLENEEALPSDWTREWHRVQGLIELARAEGEGAIDFLAGHEAPRGPAVLPMLQRLRISVLAVALVGLAAGAFFINRTLDNRREALMTRVIARGRQIAPELQHKEQTLAALKRYAAERFPLSRLMFAIAQIAPDGIVLDTLTLDPTGAVSMTGRCQNFSQGQEFERKLNDSELFTSAKTTSLGREGDRISFKTTFVLTPKAKTREAQP